jgi:hypothetical protein
MVDGSPASGYAEGVSRPRYLFLLGSLLATLGSPLPGAWAMEDLGDTPRDPLLEAESPPPPPVAPAPPPPFTTTAVVRAAARALSDPLASPGMEELGSEIWAEIGVAGHVLPALGWQVGVAGSYGLGLTPNDSRLSLLDAIGKVELAPSFNLWLGRLPVVADRASLGTLATRLTWSPLGTFSRLAGPVGLRRGTDLRGTGVVAWGRVGRVAYHLGAYDPQTLGTDPLASARVSLTFGREGESGFFRPASYYGGKRVFALAAFAQYQGQGSLGGLAPDAFKAVGGDLFLERGDDVSGVVDGEASLARFWGRNEAIELFGSAQVGYLVPVAIGPGRFQTVLRGQYGYGAGDADFLLVDGQLGYVLAGPKARLLAMYQYGSIPAGAINLVLLGLHVATE